MSTTNLAVIIGHRGCFPGRLAEEGRRELLGQLKAWGVRPIVVGEKETRYGAVENLAEAGKCAAVFRKNREKISGILVSLPNFGDERAIAETIKMSELNVPVLVHAWPDDLPRMEIGSRRDSLCGKLSVCNVLGQYGIRFSLTDTHTVSPDSKEFRRVLDRFLAVCRVTNGLRRARIGVIGARTTAFKTVRFSEKLLQAGGISVETIDFSEIVTAVQKLKDSDPEVRARLTSLKKYCSTHGVPAEALATTAKMGVVIECWVKENELNAYALQCWPAMQETLRIFPCALMSVMSESGLPAACEADALGALSMYALQLAADAPAGLFDWNDNYGADPDKAVLFHCCNAPKSMMDNFCVDYNSIAVGSGGRKEDSYGTCSAGMKKGPITFCRVTTDDTAGVIASYAGEGEITGDPLKSFGGVGVARIENLQEWLKFFCRNGFEHHVAISRSRVADVLRESFANYLDWDVKQP